MTENSKGCTRSSDRQTPHVSLLTNFKQKEKVRNLIYVNEEFSSSKFRVI